MSRSGDLKKIGKAVKELSREVAGLRLRVDELSADREKPMSLDEKLRFLDGFRAGEALGEAAVGAWIATCQTDCLRGGLRTVQMREGSHARLLEQRIKELGGTPTHEQPEQMQRETMELYGSTKLSDTEKLDRICGMFDADALLTQLRGTTDRICDDDETQFLLRTIIDDEQATLTLLAEAHDLLCAPS